MIIQGPESSAFLINIHEPIIWRLHEMIQQVNLCRIYDNRTTAVSVDPIIQIGYVRSYLKFVIELCCVFAFVFELLEFLG